MQNDDNHDGLRTPNETFSMKSQNFGPGQTIWANKFQPIWGIFGQFISTHVVHVVFHLSIIILTKK